MDVELPHGFGPLHRVTETGSTNADLLAAGGPTGEILVTDHQTAGRGRYTRRWEEPPGSSLLFSVRLRPLAPRSGWAWLSPLTGLALAEAAGRRVQGVTLKWPNDVLVEGRKIAGILVEAAGDAVVIGVGCNIAQTEEQLPVPNATSLALAGATDLDRDRLLGDLLAGLARRFAALEAAAGDAVAAGLHAEYVAACATVGTEVSVALGEETVTGRATGVSPVGGLLVETPDGPREVHAGDVTPAR